MITFLNLDLTQLLLEEVLPVTRQRISGGERCVRDGEILLNPRGTKDSQLPTNSRDLEQNLSSTHTRLGRSPPRQSETGRKINKKPRPYQTNAERNRRIKVKGQGQSLPTQHKTSAQSKANS